MYKILTLNKIAEVGLRHLPKENYEMVAEGADADGILLRSFNMHDMALPKSLKAIGRAGAGVNNIPVEQCAQKGIVVFNTPGANANAVKELVVAGLLLSSRKIVDGIQWVQSLQNETGVAKLVEQGKSQFVGPELAGKKLGVVGLGAIGVLVANAAHALGMEVYGCDPFISVDAAWRLSRGVNKANSVDDILAACDYISVHVPLNDKTKHMINDEALSKVKPGARLLNFSRGELVDDAAVKAALGRGLLSAYVTDFPNEGLLGCVGVLAIPHLGASTPESEDNCAEMAAKQLKDYLEYGNIVNSVNFPDCVLPYAGKKRVCIIHHNVPSVVGPLTTAFAQKRINIDKMISMSKGDYAYAIIDADGPDVHVVEADLMAVEGVINVRFL